MSDYERLEVAVSNLRVRGDASFIRNVLAGNDGNQAAIDDLLDASVTNAIHDTWKPPAQPNYPKPEFRPNYLPGNDKRSCAINAIIEIRALWEYVEKQAYYDYSEMYSQLLIPMTKTITTTCNKHKQSFAVYDKKTKKWLVESTEPSYRYCYNGKDFQEFEEGKTKLNGSRLLLVGKYTVMMQEPNLLRETKSAITSYFAFQMPDMKLTVGVPGCGKTTYIIDNHRAGSLVLTSCKEGAQDIRSRMGKLKNCESSEFMGLYRTIDSYLLHSRHRRAVGDVWMDEALMEHPGKLFLACLFSRCDTMYLLGDPNQLGYINRSNEIELLYEKSSIFFKPACTLNVSYRCPVDVMAAISCKYEDGAYSTTTVLRSMSCKSYTSLENVPKVDGTKYLVFRQAEKKTMRNAGYNVSTIHEFQGKEAKHVVIVRMSHNLRGLPYDSPAHVLVGMTRHKESLVYYTPVADDLKKLIMTKFTNEQLGKHQKLITNSRVGDRNSQVSSNNTTAASNNSRVIRSNYSTVAGYKIPVIHSNYSTVAGNNSRMIRSTYSTVADNNSGVIRSNYSTVAGNKSRVIPSEYSITDTVVQGVSFIASSAWKLISNLF